MLITNKASDTLSFVLKSKSFLWRLAACDLQHFSHVGGTISNKPLELKSKGNPKWQI